MCQHASALQGDRYILKHQLHHSQHIHSKMLLQKLLVLVRLISSLSKAMFLSKQTVAQMMPLSCQLTSSASWCWRKSLAVGKWVVPHTGQIWCLCCCCMWHVLHGVRAKIS